MASYVGLNVGGKIYQTSRTTLIREPNCFFALMLTERIPSSTDDKGNYLIDRDGEVFRHVLNYLRYDRLVLPDNFDELHLIGYEADFFMLEHLRELVDRKLGLAPTSEHVTLNVGGKIFQTTIATLTQECDSLLSDMCTGKYPIARDKHGHYLIDRDGDMFRHILNFLRYQRLVLPEKFDELDLLMGEAKHFKLLLCLEHIRTLKFLAESRKEGSGSEYVDLFKTGEAYCIYSNTDSFLDDFETVPLPRSDIERTYGGVRSIPVAFDESLVGTWVSTSRGFKAYPRDKEDLINRVATYILRNRDNMTNECRVKNQCVKWRYEKIK